MDKLQKALKKLSKSEREQVRLILGRLISGETFGLDVKKLKGQESIFRARKGRLRVLYRIDNQGRIIVISVGRRTDTTYKL